MINPIPTPSQAFQHEISLGTKNTMITAVALLAITVAGIGAAGYFGVLGGLNSIVNTSFIGGGGALFAGALVSVFMVNRQPAWIRNLNLPYDRQVQIKVGTWEIGPLSSFHKAVYYVETGDHFDNAVKQDDILDEVVQQTEEERNLLLESWFNAMQDVDILCLQKSPDNLPDNLNVLEGFDFTERNDDKATSIMWNTEVFTCQQEYNLGNASCVLLQHNKTHLPLMVVSAHIPGFTLASESMTGDERGNKELTRTLIELKDVPYITIVAGNFNAPWIEPSIATSEYGITEALNRWHMKRHQIMAAAGYKAEHCHLNTALNKFFGPLPLHYQYVSPPAGVSCETSNDEFAIDWTNAATADLPDVQTYTFRML